jgi:SAM-dependent methyltransferase
VSLRESLPDRAGDRPFTELFTRALRGLPCSVVGLAPHPVGLPVHTWRRDADATDLALIAHCVGRTLDIGCGPGRLTAALAAAGHLVLGIDVVHEAVGQTRDRGVDALCRDVFERLPGEGRWQTALLADGNVGIGGDPEVLLARTRELLDPEGRAVVELEPPGVPSAREWAVLECGETRSRPFRWALLGVDDIDDVAAAAGFDRVDLHRSHGRWCAVLHP